MRLRSFRKKAEAKALQKIKMKPWLFGKKAESKVRQKDVHREGLRPSSFCYSMNHALSIILVFNV